MNVIQRQYKHWFTAREEEKQYYDPMRGVGDLVTDSELKLDTDSEIESNSDLNNLDEISDDEPKWMDGDFFFYVIVFCPVQ